MKGIKFVFALVCLLLVQFSLAKESAIRGTIIDDERNELYNNYYLDLEFLENNNLFVYSPLPRRPNEIDVSADNSVYQLSFKGVENSVFLRMALLNLILSE